MTELISNKGSFSAKENSPSLSNRFYSGVYGDYYTVSESGTINFGTGSVNLNKNDIIVWNGSYFEQYSAAASLGLDALTGPDHDAILFWDDSSSSLNWMTAGANLLIEETEIKHTTPGDSFAYTPTADSGGSTTFVKSIDIDENGHIRSVTTDVSSDELLNLTADTGTASVNLSTQSLGIEGGDHITSIASGQTVTLNHDGVGAAASTLSVTGGNYMTSIQLDDKGHVVAVTGGTFEDIVISATADEIPFVNSTGDGFEYTENFKYDGDSLIVRSSTNTSNVLIGSGLVSTLDAGAASNTAVGVAALASLVDGVHNTALGTNAANKVSTGEHNTMVGSAAGFYISTGNRNAIFGRLAGYGSSGNSLGVSYTALFGMYAGYANEANAISAFGYGAMFNNTTAASNSAFGYFALRYNQTGTANSAFGYQAATGTTGQSHSNNSAFGYRSLYQGYGNSNSGFGAYSGYSLTTGAGNTFIGRYSGFGITTGDFNTILQPSDASALGTGIITGSYNTILGYVTGLTDQSNAIVIADGEGNIRQQWDNSLDKWTLDGSIIELSDATPEIHFNTSANRILYNGVNISYVTTGQHNFDGGNILTRSGYGIRLYNPTNDGIAGIYNTGATGLSKLSFQVPNATEVASYDEATTTWDFSNALKLSSYGVQTYTGTPAYLLAVTATGDVIESEFISGNDNEIPFINDAETGFEYNPLFTLNGSVFTSPYYTQVGVGVASGAQVSHFSHSRTGEARHRFENPSTGTSASVSHYLTADTDNLIIRQYGSFNANTDFVSEFPLATAGRIAATGSGLVLHASDTTGKILFGTNNTEAMRIDENQHIGIGTDTPAYRLHVYTEAGSETAAMFESDSASNVGIRLSNTSAGGLEWAFASLGTNHPDGSGKLKIKVVGASADILNLDGVNNRIGIMNVTPLYPLHISGNTYIEGGDLWVGAVSNWPSLTRNINVQSDNIGDSAGLTFRVHDGTNNIRSAFYVSHSETSVIWDSTWSTGFSGVDMRIAGVSAIHISAGRKVGINKVGAAYELDVTGDGRFTDTLHLNQGAETTYDIARPDSEISLILGQNIASQDRGYMKLWGGGLNAYGVVQMTTKNLHIDSGTGGKTYLEYYNGGDVILGNNSWSGKVGIGTTTPSYTLDVTGDGRFTSTLTVDDLTTTPTALVGYSGVGVLGGLGVGTGLIINGSDLEFDDSFIVTDGAANDVPFVNATADGLTYDTGIFSFNPTTDTLTVGTIMMGSDAWNSTFQGIAHTSQVGTSTGYMMISNGTNTYISTGAGSGAVYLRGPANNQTAQLQVAASYAKFAGNLGVGDVTPSYRLHLDAGGTAQMGLLTGSSTNNSHIRISNTSTGGHEVGWGVTGSGNSAGVGHTFMYDYTSTKYLFFFDGNQGYLGIGEGNDAPEYALHVLGTSAGVVAAFENNTQNNASIRLISGATGGHTYSLVSTADANSIGGGKFNIHDITTSLSRFTIEGDTEWVGINTVNPGDDILDTVTPFDYSTTVGGLHVKTSVWNARVLISGDRSAAVDLIDRTATTNNKWVQMVYQDELIKFRRITDVGGLGSDTLTIDPVSERVGINNTAPAYELDVTGTGRFTSTLTVDDLTTTPTALVGHAGGTLGQITLDNTLALTGNVLGVVSSEALTWPANNTVLVSNGTDDFQAASGLTWNGSILSVGNNASTTRSIIINSDAGQFGYIQFKAGGLNRWIIGKSNQAESTGDLGSNFRIFRYNDAGAYQDIPFQIDRDSGDVGINKTSNLQAKLHVVGNSTESAVAYFEGANNGSANIRIKSTATGGKEWALLSAADGSGNFSGGQFAIYNATDTTTPFVIDSATGRIGIYNVSPEYTLDVTGTGRFSVGNGVSEVLTLEGDRNQADSEVALVFRDRNATSPTQEAGRIYSLRDGSSGAFDMRFNTTYGTVLHLDNDGSVGIGTTAPSHTLDVTGTGRFTSSVIIESVFAWHVSNSNNARQTADAREDATNYARIHWYGKNSGQTNNDQVRWALYDGNSYTNFDVINDEIVYTGGLNIAQKVTVGDLTTNVPTDRLLGHVSGSLGEVTLDSNTLQLSGGQLSVIGSALTLGEDHEIPFMNGTTDFQYSSDFTFNGTVLNLNGVLNATYSSNNTYSTSIDWSTTSGDTLKIQNLDNTDTDNYASIYMRANGSGGNFSSRIITRNITSGSGDFIIQTRWAGSAGVNFTEEAFKIDSGSGAANVSIPNGSLTIADTASTTAVDTYLGGITSAGKIEQVTVVTAAASGSGSLALADNVLTFTPPDISVSGTPTLEQVTSTGNTSTSAIRATSGSYANHFKIERTGYSGANITVTSQTTGVATQMAFTHDAANGGFLFRSRNGSSVDVDALAINEDGLVGINNLNPAYSLDIGGVGGAGTVLNLNSGQTSTYMRVGTNGGTSGYFYGNNSGEVGILDNAGAWAIRVGSGGDLVSLQDSGTAYMGFERRASRGRFIVGTNDVGTLWDQADRSAIIVDGSGTSSSPMVGLTQSGSGKGYIIASSSQISLTAAGSNDVGIGNETFGASSIFFDGSSGYLGINQTTPSRMLHVSGEGSSVDSRILMSATDHSGYSEMGVVSGGGFTQVYTSAGSLGAIIRGYTSAGTYSDAVQARITVGDIEVENGSVIAYGGKFTGTLDSSAKTDVGFGMLNSQFLYGLSANNQYARRLIGRDSLDFVVIGESGSVIPAGVKYYANNATSGYHAFYTNSTNERLKIDGNGMSTFTRTGTIGMTTGAIMSNSWILVGTETSGIGIDTNEIYAQGSTLYLGSSDATNAIRMYSGSTERARLSSDGVWYVADDIVAYSTTVSDRRLKTSFESINAIDILKQTKGYKFQWKENNKWDFGFVAQEIDDIAPELVVSLSGGLEKNGMTDYLGIHYQGYIPILVEGWNDHEDRVTVLENEVVRLKERIHELEQNNRH